MRTINSVGLALVKSFEQFRAQPYQDEGGVWTIGYGHTDHIGPDSPALSEAEAEALLRRDLSEAEESVCALVHVPLNDNQYAALVSLVYNAGPAPLSRGLGMRLNAGDYAGVADEFLRWRLAGGMVSDGLLRRRTAERALFLTLP
jgi:lysozyme